MQQFFSTHSIHAAALTCLVFCASGCGGGATRSHQDYVPAEGKARAAVEKALTAWQSGQRPGKIDAGGGTIQVVDSEWKAGKKLKGYEILQPQPGFGPPQFAVKLQVEGAAEQEVRYLVVGIDPLWVYREDDYRKAIGMTQ